MTDLITTTAAALTDQVFGTGPETQKPADTDPMVPFHVQNADGIDGKQALRHFAAEKQTGVHGMLADDLTLKSAENQQTTDYLTQNEPLQRVVEQNGAKALAALRPDLARLEAIRLAAERRRVQRDDRGYPTILFDAFDRGVTGAQQAINVVGLMNYARRMQTVEEMLQVRDNAHSSLDPTGPTASDALTRYVYEHRRPGTKAHDLAMAMRLDLRRIAEPGYLEAVRERYQQKLSSSASEMARLVTALREHTGPMSQETREFGRLVNQGELVDGIGYLMQNFHIIVGELTAESLPIMLPSMVAAAGTTLAGAPHVGALILGGAAQGLSSSLVEGGGQAVETLQRLGIDVTDPAAIKQALANPTIREVVAREAILKGSIVGAFDTASVGIAGRALAIGRRPFTRAATNLTAQTAVQGALGGAGELFGQLAIGQPIDWASVAYEIVGEMGGAVFEVAAYGPKGVVRRIESRRETRRIQAVREMAAGMQALRHKQSLDEIHKNLQEMEAGPDGEVLKQDYLNQVARGLEHEGVYVPLAEWQKALEATYPDPDERAAFEARVKALEQKQTARDTGSDIYIHTPELYRHVLTSDIYTRIADFIREDAVAPNVAETSEGTKQLVELLQEEQKAALADLKAKANEQLGRGQSVGEAVAAALIAQGQDEQIARENAAIHQAFANVLESRFGVDAAEFYRSRGLRIQIQGREASPVRPVEGSAGPVEGEGGQTPAPAAVAAAASSFAPDQAIQALRDEIGTTGLSIADLAARNDLTAATLAARALLRKQLDVATAAVEDLIAAYTDLVEVLQAEADRLNAEANAEAVSERFAQSAGVEFYYLDPTDPAVLHQDMQGAVRFSSFPDGTQDTLISVFETGNLSTFLHESAHFFFSNVEILAQAGNEAAKTEVEALKAWWGRNTEDLARQSGLTEDDVRAFLADDIARDDPRYEPLRVATQEYAARGFEAYLFEGNAPSPELRSYFRKFMAWLVTIYRQVRNLDVQMDDEARGLMDRLLATDDEIALAEEELTPLFDSAEQAGMNDADWQAYQQILASSRENARERLVEKMVVRYRRQRAADFQETRRQIEAEVEAQLADRPEVQLRRFLKDGLLPNGEASAIRAKLDVNEIREAYGNEVAQRLAMKGLADETSEHVSLDDVGQAFGFLGPDEALQAIIDLPTEARLKSEMVEQALTDRFGDGWDMNDIADDVRDAVNDNERLLQIEIEMKALAARSGEELTPRDVMKRAAEDEIDRLPVHQAVKDRTYLAAERRAARKAQEAILAGDEVEAAKQLRQQYRAYHLYLAAREAKTEIGKLKRLVKRVERPAARKSIHIDYREQIEALLIQYDFKNASLRELDQTRDLGSFLEQLSSQALTHMVPDNVIRAGARNYKEIPMAEARGLRDAIRSLAHLGANQNKLLAQEAKFTLEEAIREVDVQLREANPKRVDAEGRWKDPVKGLSDSKWEALLGRGRWLLASLRKMESLFDELTGELDGINALQRLLFIPAAEAEHREMDMRNQATVAMRDMIRRHYPKKSERYHRLESTATKWIGRRLGIGAEMVEAQGREIRVTHADAIGIALHMGNEYNREAVKEGWGLTDDQIAGILTMLDERDWNFIEDAWTYVDSFWPEMSQMMRDVVGFVPEKVEAEPFMTPSGRMVRGGYWPLKFDKRGIVGTLAAEREAAAEFKSSGFHGSTVRANTKAGASHERTSTAGQRPRTDAMNLLAEHVSEVIHDITHRKFVIDAYRVLQDGRFREAFGSAASPQHLTMLKHWVDAIAGENPDRSLQAANRLVRNVRKNTSIVAMGLKVTTAMVQQLGLFNTAQEIGYGATASGLIEMYSNPVRFVERAKWAREQSGELRNRFRTYNRDVRDAIATIKPQTGVGWLQQNAFILTQVMDMAVVLPTWYGAYNKSIAQGVTHEDAVQKADSAVRQSQGSGSAKDLPLIMSWGGEFGRFFTMFYSYFSALYNQTAKQIGRVRRNPSPGEIATAFHSFVLLYVVPPLLESLMRDGGPDDDEGYDEWALRAIGQYSLSTLPVVRDFGNFFFSGYDYKMSPVVGGFETIAQGTRAIADIFRPGELSEAEARKMVDATGYIFGLPTRQMWTTLRYMVAIMEGDADESELSAQMIWQLAVKGLSKSERQRQGPVSLFGLLD